VRKESERLLPTAGVTAELRRLAEKGKPEQRLQALKLLWASESPEVRSWAEEFAAAERAPSVRELLNDWKSTSSADEPPALELPPIDLRVPLTDDLRGRLQRLWTQVNDDIARMRGHGPRVTRRTNRRTELTDGDLQQVFKTLETGRPFETGGPDDGLEEHWVYWVFERHAEGLGPIVTTVVLARAGILLNRLGWLTDLATSIYEEQFRATGHPTLLELALLLDALGLDGRAVVADKYKRDYNGLGADWPEEAVAPFVQYALPRFLEMLATASSDWYADDNVPFRALATLPSLPREAVEVVFGVALGQRKTSRRAAQDALVRVEGFEDRVVAALTDGKADVRTNAAQWLQRLRYVPAVPALEAAVVKEKNDITKGALLDALQAYGLAVENYVDRAGLEKQAETALAKRLPKGVEWLHWETLPAVHWADTSEADAEVVLNLSKVREIRTTIPSLRRTATNGWITCALWAAACTAPSGSQGSSTTACGRSRPRAQ
jgi:hypothetical protein